MVERLLTAKANVNAAPNKSGTALQVTASCGQIEVVKRLLTAEADVKAHRKLTKTEIQ